jgi:signal transduction histidine kinase
VRKVLSSILMVLGVVAALGLILVLVSMVATGDGSSEVAREGQIAVMAESTITSASTVRNAAVNTALIHQGRDYGIYDEEAVVRASQNLTRVIDEYVRRTQRLIVELSVAEGAIVAATSDAFLGDIEALTVAVAIPGEVVDVPAAVASGSYDAAIGALVDVRNDRVQGALGQAEYAGRAADGVRFLVLVVVPLVAMLVMRSAIRRRRVQDALRVELDRQRAVIASKDEFVTNLSHELRTPLTGVYSSALALDEGALQDPETAAELTGLIVSDAAELSRMVDDLITAGQIETDSVVLAIDEIDIAPEIGTVIEPFVRSGATISYTPEDHTAVADRLRLRQIVRNLVSNAVKHGGPNIEVFTELGSGAVSLFVMDDGDGIDDDRLTRLFDRYQHEGSDPLLQGSVGMGLAVARSLAVGMGGNLTYTRTNGLTYFVLRLPSHRTGRLNERVEDSLGNETASQSASEVAKLFSR